MADNSYGLVNNQVTSNLGRASQYTFGLPSKEGPYGQTSDWGAGMKNFGHVMGMPNATKTAALSPPGQRMPMLPSHGANNWSPSQEGPARSAIPTNFGAPPPDATNQQHGRINPDIAKNYGSGYMQSEGNTTVMGSNGDMMRLNKGGYQMPDLSGGALSTISSAVENPSAEGMSASESMQRFGNVHGSYATNAMAQNQPQPPSWRNIYDDVTGNRGNMALHRWDEEDKIAKSVNDRYIGA